MRERCRAVKRIAASARANSTRAANDPAARAPLVQHERILHPAQCDPRPSGTARQVGILGVEEEPVVERTERAEQVGSPEERTTTDLLDGDDPTGTTSSCGSSPLDEPLDTEVPVDDRVRVETAISEHRSGEEGSRPRAVSSEEGIEGIVSEGCVGVQEQRVRRRDVLERGIDGSPEPEVAPPADHHGVRRPLARRRKTTAVVDEDEPGIDGRPGRRRLHRRHAPFEEHPVAVEEDDDDIDPGPARRPEVAHHDSISGSSYSGCASWLPCG